MNFLYPQGVSSPRQGKNVKHALGDPGLAFPRMALRVPGARLPPARRRLTAENRSSALGAAAMLPAAFAALAAAAFIPFSAALPGRAAMLAQAEFDVNAEARERLGRGTQVNGTGLARREIDSRGRAQFDAVGQMHLDTHVLPQYGRGVARL